MSDRRWVCYIGLGTQGSPYCSPELPHYHRPCGWFEVTPSPVPSRPDTIPPNTLNVLADEVEAGGHTFAANTMRSLASGAVVVRGVHPATEGPDLSDLAEKRKAVGPNLRYGSPLAELVAAVDRLLDREGGNP